MQNLKRMPRTLIDECEDGDIEAVKEMIANGVDEEMTDINGATPVYISIKNGQLEIAEILIVSGLYA